MRLRTINDKGTLDEYRRRKQVTVPCMRTCMGVARRTIIKSANLPRFIDVVKAVLSEMQVESAVVATELPGRNPEVDTGLKHELGATPIAMMSHEAFKALSAKARAIVRTGEFSPYANVILRAGVVF